MTRRFDAVVFDFGGVVSTSPFALMEDVGARMGLEPGVLLELLMGDYGTDGDEPWHRLERGEITALDWFAGLLARAEAQCIVIDTGEFTKGFYGDIGIHDVVVDRIHALRAEGYRTALLTNNVKEFAGWRQLVPVDDLFEVVVDSSEVGMRKPGAAIYEHTLALLGLTADRVVFLDDHPANVAGAEAVGMTAIHVGHDPAHAIAALDVLLAG